MFVKMYLDIQFYPYIRFFMKYCNNFLDRQVNLQYNLVVPCNSHNVLTDVDFLAEQIRRIYYEMPVLQ